MFNFDVHDDVRLLADASVEKDEVRFFPHSRAKRDSHTVLFCINP